MHWLPMATDQAVGHYLSLPVLSILILALVAEPLLHNLRHVVSLADAFASSADTAGRDPQEEVRLEVVDLVEEGVESASRQPSVS
jgi:hypothetical protein